MKVETPSSVLFKVFSHKLYETVLKIIEMKERINELSFSNKG